MSLTANRPALDIDAVAAYIERCRTPDGGFFYARVPPASARDTYHALEALYLLGREPAEKDALLAWAGEAVRSSLAGQLYGLFYLTKAAGRLGMEMQTLREWAQATALPVLTNRCPPVRVYVEAPSELEAIYMAVESCLELGLKIDHERVIRFLLDFQNPDGGFGGEGRSTIASTYYAVATLARLGLENSRLGKAADWLSAQRHGSMARYLEQLHWLVAGLLAIGRPVPEPERAVSFVLACRQPSGGFARAMRGIPTLEHTHYALCILRAAGVISGQREGVVR